MDELDISGKRYISTRRAARQHGYHSDYMGQLIRSKKVVGQKVGRAWYIEEESLDRYLGRAPATSEPIPTAGAVNEQTGTEPDSIVEESNSVELQERREEVPASEGVDSKTEETSLETRATPEAEEERELIQLKEQVEEEGPALVPIRKHETTSPLRSNGLRYVSDDIPAIPIVTRMPPVSNMSRQPVVHGYEAVVSTRFPFISLSIVGVCAIIGAVFVSHFVSATIVSEEGKSAIVEYAIHW